MIEPEAAESASLKTVWQFCDGHAICTNGEGLNFAIWQPRKQGSKHILLVEIKCSPYNLRQPN